MNDVLAYLDRLTQAPQAPARQTPEEVLSRLQALRQEVDSLCLWMEQEGAPEAAGDLLQAADLLQVTACSLQDAIA